mgnify:FL=1
MEIENNEERIKEFKKDIAGVLPEKGDIYVINDFWVALIHSEILIIKSLVSQGVMSKKDAITNIENVREQMVKAIKDMEVNE